MCDAGHRGCCYGASFVMTVSYNILSRPVSRYVIGASNQCARERVRWCEPCAIDVPSPSCALSPISQVDAECTSPVSAEARTARVVAALALARGAQERAEALKAQLTAVRAKAAQSDALAKEAKDSAEKEAQRSRKAEAVTQRKVADALAGGEAEARKEDARVAAETQRPDAEAARCSAYAPAPAKAAAAGRTGGQRNPVNTTTQDTPRPAHQPAPPAAAPQGAPQGEEEAPARLAALQQELAVAALAAEVAQQHAALTAETARAQAAGLKAEAAAEAAADAALAQAAADKAAAAAALAHVKAAAQVALADIAKAGGDALAAAKAASDQAVANAKAQSEQALAGAKAASEQALADARALAAAARPDAADDALAVRSSETQAEPVDAVSPACVPEATLLPFPCQAPRPSRPSLSGVFDVAEESPSYPPPEAPFTPNDGRPSSSSSSRPRRSRSTEPPPRRKSLPLAPFLSQPRKSSTGAVDSCALTRAQTVPTEASPHEGGPALLLRSAASALDGAMPARGLSPTRAQTMAALALAAASVEDEGEMGGERPSPWEAPRRPPPAPSASSWLAPEVHALNAELSDVRAFVHAAGPRGGVNCHVRRTKAGALGGGGASYSMYIEGPNPERVAGDPLDARLVLYARQERMRGGSRYSISLDSPSQGKASAGALVGSVSSNFLGTEFVCVDAQGQEQCAVTYALNPLGTRGPRQMVAAAALPGQPSPPGQLLRCARSLSRAPGVELLQAKAPRWSEALQAFCLNFHGRVSMASVKNIQIVQHEHDVRPTLQFGKVDDDVFTLDYAQPLSALQAFMIAITSTDNKLACE